MCSKISGVCISSSLFIMGIFFSSLCACTDFLLVAKDGAAINGRSMEFGIDLHPQLVVHPKGEKLQSRAPNNGLGLSWNSQFGYLAVNVLGLDCAVDGVNEKGLSFGALWLPGSEYESVPLSEQSKALTLQDVGNWILGNFETTAQVREGFEKVLIWAEPIAEVGGIPPLHIAVHDAKGNSLVVEFIRGKKRIHENKVAVLTNAPQFEWHIKNLGNYLNLRAVETGSVDINSTVLSAPGKGGGLLGIPGDWMPSSRFVRIVAFKEFAKKPQDFEKGVNLAFHLLNTVDIPFGANISETKKGTYFDYTQWVVVKDLKNKILYFRTYEDIGVQSVALDAFNLQAEAEVVSCPMKQACSQSTDIHEQFKPIKH